MSTLRRLKVIGEYDKDLMAFCQTFKNFQAEAPDLFGTEFREKALSYLAQVRELRKAKASKGQDFSKAPPQMSQRNQGGSETTRYRRDTLHTVAKLGTVPK